MSEAIPVRFVDLPAQYADFEHELVQGLTEIIHRGAFVGGAHLEQFEHKLADFSGTKFAVGCSDGTAALKLALLAAGIKPGDGVIVPTNSFIASAFAVTHAGGRPVFVDCDHRTYLLDIDQVEDQLKAGKARFVMSVHLYGNPCPMNEILALAAKFGALVIEDNAQAIGAELGGQRTGSFGIAAGVSFYPAKNLGAFGQGGAVLTSDPKIAETVRMYAQQGQAETRYYHQVVGYNDRLDTIQGFVLDKLLAKVDDFNARRRQRADWYAARLPGDRIQQRTKQAKPVYHLLEFDCHDAATRDRLADALKGGDIGYGFHYPVPIHKQQAYPEDNALSFPVAESLAERLISLPMHPFLTQEQVGSVCDAVLSVVNGG